jgi:hypothetical protein
MSKRPNRKISQAMEGIVVKLTPQEVEETRASVMDMLDQKKAIEFAKKSAMSEFKAKLQELEERLSKACTEASTGKRELDVIVEEYLTSANEVVKIRADTGEPIGKPRTATVAELQEPIDMGGADSGFQ